MVDPHGLFHGLSQCIPMAYPIFHGEITTILAGYIRKSSTLFGEFPMIHPWICKGTAGNPSPKNLLIPQVVDFPLGEKTQYYGVSPVLDDNYDCPLAISHSDNHHSWNRIHYRSIISKHPFHIFVGIY